MDIILYGKSREAVIRADINDLEALADESNDEYALVLSDRDIRAIAVSHADSLERSGRIEIMGGLAAGITKAFSTSPYFVHSDFADGICRIIDAFYQTKNDCNDRIGDDDLIDFMVNSFNTTCGGSLDFLIEHQLPMLAQSLLSAERASDNNASERKEDENDEY